jgi:hypothetical protein
MGNTNFGRVEFVLGLRIFNPGGPLRGWVR